MINFLAWLYWNPPRNLFIIPYLNHPVTIYGVCFVTGFIIGYFLLAAMFKRKLLDAGTLRERDIQSWTALIQYLQIALDKPDYQAAPLLQKLDKKACGEILSLKCHQEPSQKLKSAILASINDSPVKFTRATLEELFPDALITAKQWGYNLTDKLTWYVVLGTIIGARLGDVFFYDWPYFKHHPLAIFMIWKGGLASHGGVLGVFIAVYLYYRWILKPFPEFSFITLLDMLVVPSGLVACFIRIGNFFNQEILGPESHLPWAIIFGDPIDGGPVIPRHPTQLYEAVIYLGIFIVMLILWQTRSTKLKPGFICGLFFIAVFGFRFLIEFIKEPQSQMIDESFLQMGQYLSIPFVLFGVSLMAFGQRWSECKKCKL